MKRNGTSAEFDHEWDNHGQLPRTVKRAGKESTEKIVAEICESGTIPVRKGCEKLAAIGVCGCDKSCCEIVGYVERLDENDKTIGEL